MDNSISFLLLLHLLLVLPNVVQEVVQWCWNVSLVLGVRIMQRRRRPKPHLMHRLYSGIHALRGMSSWRCLKLRKTQVFPIKTQPIVFLGVLFFFLFYRFLDFISYLG